MTGTRLQAFLLLALANLFWSGNWIAGRALREAFEPATLNFWRWLIATLVLAPFALPRLRGKTAALRRNAGILLLLAPVVALQGLWGATLSPLRWPGAAAALGVAYMAVAASVLAYIFWNRGVAAVGANAAGFTVHLLPAFGTLLAILFLGEAFAGFHAAGIATILAGVLLATRAAPAARS
ncbi:MAG: DMT family transporter [Burkholderiales bacterium]